MADVKTHDIEAHEGEKSTVYREGAIAGEGGETKRGLKSRHIQFLYVYPVHIYSIWSHCLEKK